MYGYLRRLLTTTVAYQIGDIVSRVFAVILLPVYTRHVATAGYGIAEQMMTFVILVSIFVRFGVGEAFVRYYYRDEDPVRRAALARRSTGFLLVSTTVFAAIGAVFAGPLSQALLQHHDPGAVQISMLGLWAFTNLELAYAMLRVDERVKAYAITTLSNVLLTIVSTFVLVVGFDKGAHGLLLGNYGASAIVLLGLWWSLRGRLFVPADGVSAARVGESLRQMLRFGLPTVPADASVYALNFVDRFYLVHRYGLATAGIYSAGVKLAGVTAFVARAFQYSWPPLAYSIRDDAEASRFYAFVATYYLVVTGWLVAGLLLLGRWMARLLLAPAYFDSYKALPWLALGWALYGLFVIFIVIAGRAEVTTRNFPAAACGLAANIGLLFLLVPPLGLAGAGLALTGAYIVMLFVMRLLTRRLFHVAFEWARIAHLAVVLCACAATGELLLPTHGFVGFVTRALVTLAIGPLLWLTRFVRPEERGYLTRMAAPVLRRMRRSAA